VNGGASVEEAVLAVVKDVWAANRRVVFNGDGYSEDWHREAEQRGLENLRTTPDALPALISEQTVKAFEGYDVLTERELHARFEVMAEQYVTSINIEAETAAQIARTMLLPATVQHLARLRAAGDGEGLGFLAGETTELLDGFVQTVRTLEEKNLGHPHDGEVLDHARYVRDEVIPAMNATREVADRLERIVSDDLWPLPKYSEVLFIK
jgi:glutamine synthetase